MLLRLARKKNTRPRVFFGRALTERERGNTETSRLNIRPPYRGRAWARIRFFAVKKQKYQIDNSPQTVNMYSREKIPETEVTDVL